MVNFTIEKIREIMYQPEKIRNFSVIAHVDHGKTTLTDSLIAKAGIISMESAGNKRYMSEREDEIERGITIKSTGISLYFETTEKETKVPYLFNLIDSPGHADFSSEVTAALRVTDGALVVVDCIEGVCVQTETVLRQALLERIKPVLFLNKVDRPILELQVDGETMYKMFEKSISGVNIVLATYQNEDMIIEELHPAKGTIAFGSGKDCWAFTLDQFARMYASKLNIPAEKLVEKLWGDNYYDPKAKAFVTEGAGLKRSFVEFILDPILEIMNAAMKDDKEKISDICKKIKVELSPSDLQLTGKKLCRAIMQKWINAADSILDMCVKQLPSPKEAQKYRYKYLYEGDPEDEFAQAIKNCDPEGPLMMYISKMVPSSDKGRFLAFGRVFSGKVVSGQEVRLLGPNFKQGSKFDTYKAQAQKCVVMMGRFREQVLDVPCGNTGAIMGIDKFLSKTGTVCDNEKASNIRPMKFSVSPVVRVAVEPVNPVDMPKLIEGMRKLSQVDNIVVCQIDEQTGQNIVAGSGELHVEICLNDLRNFYANVPIKCSNPLVSYMETVTEKSQFCVSKSANKHNRIYCTSEPLDKELTESIEAGAVKPTMEKKDLTNLLVNTYRMEKNDVAKIWAFGPNDEGPNMLIDMTEACTYMKEIKDSCVTAFNEVCNKGILCDEPLRGVRFNIIDTKVHADNAHRGTSQILPCMKRTCYGSQLMAKPRLLQPIFLAEIVCPESQLPGVYSVVTKRKGTVEEQIFNESNPLVTVRSYLPVAESFGFTSELRSETSGQAFPVCYFDHWEEMTGDPFSKTANQAKTVIEEIRVRKGLKKEIPSIDDFYDKI